MKRISNKKLCLLISLLLLATVAVGSTLAVLTAQSQVVENQFIPGSVSTDIDEEFDGTTKSDVKLVNTSNIKAYLRAKIVVTWQDADGNVYSDLPVENTHYTIDYTDDSNWVQYGDYWYYTKTVEPGDSTSNLIDECVWTAEGPKGYTLNLEILAEAIQGIPETAVQDAWGVTISQGSVSTVE